MLNTWRNHRQATKGSSIWTWSRIMELLLHARERGDNINDAQCCITGEPSGCCGWSTLWKLKQRLDNINIDQWKIQLIECVTRHHWEQQVPNKQLKQDWPGPKKGAPIQQQRVIWPLNLKDGSDGLERNSWQSTIIGNEMRSDHRMVIKPAWFAWE